MTLWYHIIFAVLFAGADVIADKSEGKNVNFMSCNEFFKGEFVKEHCCTVAALPVEIMQVTRECFENKKENEWTCKDSECVFKNVSTDGKLDEKKIVNILDKIDKEKSILKPITARVRKMCLDEGYRKFPSREECPASKMMRCMYSGIVECPSWKNSDTCKIVAGIAEKCKIELDSM